MPAAPSSSSSPPTEVPLLVTGAGGMLGQDLADAVAARAGVLLRSRHDLDVTDPDQVDEAVAAVAGGVALNAAAWTDVDGAEGNEAAALAVNGHAVGHLAAACERHGVALVQVSTDYVLAGAGPEPLAEDSPAGPVNAYGRGKLVGERAALEMPTGRGVVVRTEWLYGRHGGSFVRTMRRLALADGPVDVVDDQTGQPTCTADLATALVALADRIGAGNPPGSRVLHATAQGATSWFGLAREVFVLAGADPDRVQPARSAAVRRPAVRPSWSVLGHSAWDAAGLPPLPHWKDALRARWPALDRTWADAETRR